MNTLTFDIEAYKNYTLFAFRDVETLKLTTFEMRGKKKSLKPKKIKKLHKMLLENTIVTFNGLKFDEPITAHALKGATAYEIHKSVQALIVGGITPYNFYRSIGANKFIPHHIDIMDVARGSASLKLYGARLGTKKLQDLPYDPLTTLSQREMDEVLLYCENDNIVTDELFQYLKPDLDLRQSMSDQYDINFMSFKGAKIAELVIAQECGYTGKYPSIPKSIKYKPPEYIKFKSPVLKELFKQIAGHVYILGEAGNVLMPDFLKDEVEFDDIMYKFGIGGLHGSVSSTTITPKKGEVIVDIDYKSLYPSLIIQNNFSPRHIGSMFADVFRELYHQRNNVLKPAMKTVEYNSDEYKDLDRKQNTMKLVLNSSFGQTGQRYSKIYDPSVMLHTTLTGQLTLMMVIEKLYLKGFHTFYANTDGITLKVKKKDLPIVQKITQKFDEKTGLEMEYNFFKSSHIRDVNNFVNITDDNKVKSKGAFAEPDLEKNAQVPIVFEAVRKYLLDGTPVEKTIKACKLPKDFCSSAQVNGGAMYATSIPDMYPPDWEEKLNSTRGLTKKIIKEREKLEAVWVKDNGNYLGKVVRWYYSTDGATIHRKQSGYKVPMTDGSKPMMTLSKKLPKDLDYEWYYDYADRMLSDLGVEL